MLNLLIRKIIIRMDLNIICILSLIIVFRVQAQTSTSLETSALKQNVLTPIIETINDNRSVYTGKPISLDFKDVPVRQVLQIIAQLNDYNLVTTDTVTGNVTINLQDVPWDQALAMILKIRGLDQRIEGNILLIAPQEELAARESAVLQAQQQVQNLAPLVSENVRVNYAKAEQMASLLQSSNGGILSARGSVAVDERTNTLLLRDSADSISMAKILLKELDVPVKQVLIESRMVTVRDNVDEQLGVRWGLTGRQGDAALSGSAIAASNINSGVIPELSDRLNVNLPVANAAGRIGVQIASLMDGTILDLELSALETENRGEIIASPRITDFCGTNRFLSKIDPSVKNICPSCGQPDESTSHITRCSDPGRIASLEAAIDDLSDWMDENDTDPILQHLIEEYLLGRGVLQMADIIEAEQEYIDFATIHDDLGWDNFVEGRISKSLVHLQTQYLSTIHTYVKSSSWASGLIRQLLILTHQQWLYRNCTVHYKTDGRSLPQHKEILQKVTALLHTDEDMLLPEDQDLLHIDFAQLGKGPTIDQERWIASMNSALSAGRIHRARHGRRIRLPRLRRRLRSHHHSQQPSDLSLSSSESSTEDDEVNQPAPPLPPLQSRPHISRSYIPH